MVKHYGVYDGSGGRYMVCQVCGLVRRGHGEKPLLNNGRKP